MNVLVDTDVLLDVALDRSPWVDDAVAFLDHCQAGRCSCRASWHSLATVFYLASGAARPSAKTFIRELLTFAEVAPVAHQDMLFALELEMADLEDAMQVAAALACRATRIVTRNTKDFKHSPVRAVTPAELLQELAP